MKTQLTKNRPLRTAAWIGVATAGVALAAQQYSELSVSNWSEVGLSNEPGVYGFAVGVSNDTNTQRGFATGGANICHSGYDIIAAGAYNEVSGSQSGAIGYENEIGECALNGVPTTYAHVSYAIGFKNKVLEDHAYALGEGLEVDDFGSVAVGGFNDPSDSDTVFVVGNGTASQGSNALVVFRNGDVVIPTTQGDIPLYNAGN